MIEWAYEYPERVHGIPRTFDPPARDTDTTDDLSQVQQWKNIYFLKDGRTWLASVVFDSEDGAAGWQTITEHAIRGSKPSREMMDRDKPVGLCGDYLHSIHVPWSGE